MTTFRVNLLASMQRGFRCRNQFTVKAKDQPAAVLAAERLMRDHTAFAHSMNPLAVEVEQVELLPEEKP